MNHLISKRLNIFNKSNTNESFSTYLRREAEDMVTGLISGLNAAMNKSPGGLPDMASYVLKAAGIDKAAWDSAVSSKDMDQLLPLVHKLASVKNSRDLLFDEVSKMAPGLEKGISAFKEYDRAMARVRVTRQNINKARAAGQEDKAVRLEELLKNHEEVAQKVKESGGHSTYNDVHRIRTSIDNLCKNVSNKAAELLSAAGKLTPELATRQEERSKRREEQLERNRNAPPSPNRAITEMRTKTKEAVRQALETAEKGDLKNAVFSIGHDVSKQKGRTPAERDLYVKTSMALANDQNLTKDEAIAYINTFLLPPRMPKLQE